MPLSKRRKKKGKVVKNSRTKRNRRIQSAGDDLSSGVTLQELINIVAYQEYEKKGELPHQQKENEDAR